MTFAESPAGRFLPSDPILDRRGRQVPEGMAFVLGLLRVLLTYGRHLTATLDQRATRRTFSVIAQYFGTSRVSFILARVSRGVLRAIALERVLMERAARGGDLHARTAADFTPRKKRPPAEKQQEEQPAKTRPARRPDPDASLTLDNMPTVEDLVAEIRRRRWIGRALADICCDLGIGASVCEGNFATALYQAMSWYRGSFARYYREMRRREKAYADELDWNRNLNIRYDWPDHSAAGARSALGFFVGEDPVSPSPPPDPPAAAELTPPRPPLPPPPEA